MIYDTLAFRTIFKRANDVVKLELELDLLWFIEMNFAVGNSEKANMA